MLCPADTAVLSTQAGLEACLKSAWLLASGPLGPRGGYGENVQTKRVSACYQVGERKRQSSLLAGIILFQAWEGPGAFSK